MGTKRSLKGTLKTTLAQLTRDFRISGWFSDTTPASAQDNPIEFVLVKKLIDDISGRFLEGLIELAAPTTDVVAFDTADAITSVGSVYTVNRVFYLYKNGEFYKVNTGSDTEVGTIELQLSSTEDGMYRTCDIADSGAGGTTIVEVTNIIWLYDNFSFDHANTRLRVKQIVDEDDTGAVDFPRGATGNLTGNLTGNTAGTHTGDVQADTITVGADDDAVGIGGLTTPTATNLSNLDSASITRLRYAAIGDHVIAYFSANVDPTAAAACSFRLPCPNTPDTFIAGNRAEGSAITDNAGDGGAAISSVNGTTSVLVSWAAVGTSTQIMNGSFIFSMHE